MPLNLLAHLREKAAGRCRLCVLLQAAIIARKKEVAAEKLREAREELERYEREAIEKRDYMKQCDGSDTLKGEDVSNAKG